MSEHGDWSVSGLASAVSIAGSTNGTVNYFITSNTSSQSNKAVATIPTISPWLATAAIVIKARTSRESILSPAPQRHCFIRDATDGLTTSLSMAHTYRD